jgi:hypothetical protein
VQFLGEPIEWVEQLAILRWLLIRGNLVGRRQPGEEEGSSKIGRAWPPPLQVKRSVSQKLCAALQAAHPSYDGLRMSDLAVRCCQPCPDAASLTVQVSSHCD